MASTTGQQSLSATGDEEEGTPVKKAATKTRTASGKACFACRNMKVSVVLLLSRALYTLKY
jgi:hypothetical protein